MPDDRHSRAVDPPSSLPEPPRGTLLDRLARWLEGGGHGAPVETVVDLADVLDPRELSHLPRHVVDLYAVPSSFRIRAGYDAPPFSRALLAVFGKLTRQMNVPDRVRGFEDYPLGQLTYRDDRGRTHWDRYALVDGAYERLFIARVAGSRGHFVETFSLYGFPIALTFRASVEDDTLVLTLLRRWSSPLSWFARVQYRTGFSAGEVRTHGDFRVDALRFRARTEFRATPPHDP